MPDTRYVGQPARRVDALEKVLGTARYVGDYRLPGMLLARCLRSTLPHARIVRLDVAPALRVPGVLAAITCDDFVNHGKFGFPIEDQYMLAYERVRYVGDAVAAVAAISEDALAAGLAAIELEFEALPALFDPVEALKPGAPVIGERPWDAPSTPRGNLLVDYVVRQGEPVALLAQCDVRIDEVFTTAHQEHAYLETEAALAVPWPAGASVDMAGGPGSGVTVYSSNQSPFNNRDNLCKVLGLGPEHVRCIQPPVGGAFGGKDDLLYQTSAQVAKLALLTGRPVRMTFPREESMIASYKRDAMQMYVELGADAGGRLRAAQIHAVVDSGGYASITPLHSLAFEHPRHGAIPLRSLSRRHGGCLHE